MTVLHPLLAAFAAIALVPIVALARIEEPVGVEAIRATLVVVLPLASAAASAILIATDRALGRRSLRVDAISYALALALIARLIVAPVSRDGVGLVLVLVLAIRVGPALWIAIADRRSGAGLAFAICFVAYAAIAMWGLVGMAAQGDQPHYLLAAEALRNGTIDVDVAYADPQRYESLAQQPLSDEDRTTHLVTVGGGSRLLQGYGLPAVLLLGWAIGGRAGAVLTIALIAAYASAQTQRLARDVAGDSVGTRAAWALLAFTVPFLSFATEVFPNALGAALLVSVARWGIVPGGAPASAAIAAGLTLFLTPRDGMTAALLVFAAVLFGRGRVKLIVVGLVLLALACVVAFLIYGVPLPYAGYFLGAAQVDRLPDAKLVGLRPDVALPGMLFDRAFGLAGTAPWVFAGALGVGPLLRRDRPRGVTLLAVVLATIAALALYGPWQGGWSPPNRYMMELLPLWTPFVAAGLAAATALWQRAVVGVLVVPSLVASLWLAAIPRLAYSGNESELVRWLSKYLPQGVLTALPSFAVDPLASAELRSVAFALGVAALVAFGVRRPRLAS